MAAGSIVVDLLMRTGAFETDTARAQKALTAFQKTAVNVGKTIGTAIGGGITAAAAAFELLVHSAGNFKDIEEQTGSTAESLASLAIPAAVAGTNVEELAGQMNKLTKSLIDVDDNSKPVGAALQALGIPIEDFKKLDPVGQIDALTKAFNGFADGSGKTAIALTLFGKAGASTLNVFKELGAEGGRQVILTQQQIELADDFADKQAKQAATIKQYAQAGATDLLPVLNDLTGAAKELAAEFFGIDAAGKKLAGESPVKAFGENAASVLAFVVDAGQGVVRVFEAIGIGIGATAARTGAILHGEFAQASTIAEQARADIDKVLSAELFSQRLARLRAASAAAVNAPTAATAAKPELKFNGAPKKPDGDAQSALKKSLDGQIKLIEDFGKNQAEAFKVGEQFLDGVYQDGLISQADFFATQKQVRDAALTEQLASIDKEIAALQRFANDPAAKPADRVSANEKIKLSEQQRAEVVTKASAADILAAQANARAVEQLQDRYTDLRATVLAGSGDEFGAAALKNAQQVRDAARLVTQAGGDTTVVDQLKLQLDYRAQAAQQQKEYSKLLEATQSKEAEIYLDATANGKGELEVLAAIRDARKQAIILLQQQAQAAADLAALSGNDADIQRANDLALALKKAALEIDPLAQKINGTLEDAGASAFSSFFDRTKSAKEAFRDFANSVIKSITDIAAKNLAKSIFGQDAGLGGLGGLLSGLFGSGTGVSTNNTGTGLPTAGGAATGTNFVERDMLTILHKGEAVVPKAYNPAQGGGVTIINQAPGVQVRRNGNDSSGNPQFLVEQILDQASQRGARDFQSGTGPMATAARSRLGLGSGSLAKRG